MAVESSKRKISLLICFILCSGFIGCTDSIETTPEFFTCDDGQLIHYEKLEDGVPNCSDGSDESKVFLQECDNGQIILSSKWENGVVDCEDGSDEGCKNIQNDWIVNLQMVPSSKFQNLSEQVIADYLYYFATGSPIAAHKLHLTDNGFWSPVFFSTQGYEDLASKIQGICEFEIIETIETNECVEYADSITVIGAKYRLLQYADGHNSPSLVTYENYFTTAKTLPSDLNGLRGDWGIYPNGYFPSVFDCNLEYNKNYTVEQKFNFTDSDNDGLSDQHESYIYFTDVDVNDTDQDGISDNDEISKYFTNPLLKDTDGDGLSDGEEIFANERNELFTNPLTKDSDGDGLNDSQEIENGSDPWINVNTNYYNASNYILFSDNVTTHEIGRMMAISENQIITAGAHGNSGIVFTKNESTWDLQDIFWEEEAKDVAISGDYAAFGTGSSVYVFKNINNQWELDEILANPENQGYSFGNSIDIYANYIAISSKDIGNYKSNLIYIFQRDENNWIQKAKLNDSNPEDDFYSAFGHSLAINENYLVVGAPEDDYYDSEAGTVYVFKNEEDEWKLEQILSMGDDYELFGSSVSIDNETILIGASSDDSISLHYSKGGDGDELFNWGQGSAYIFVKEDEDWVMKQKLMGESGGTRDLFGHSVSINGKYIIIGAPGQGSRYNTSVGLGSYEDEYEDSFCDRYHNGFLIVKLPCDINAGSIYIFENQDNTNWKLYSEIINPFPIGGSYSYGYFGWSVDIDNELNVVAGAPQLGDIYCTHSHCGAIYVCKIFENGLTGNDDCNIDIDGDNLSNEKEINVYGTNPFVADTDGDGLNDYDEIKLHLTNPKQIDTDNDGLLDIVEANPFELFDGLIHSNNPWISKEGYQGPNSTCQVTFYEHGDFTGKQETYWPGKYNFNFPNDWRHEISSMKVSSGCMLITYESNSFSGVSVTLVEGDYNVVSYVDAGGTNGGIRSVEIFDIEYNYILNWEPKTLDYISALTSDSDGDGILDGVEVMMLQSNPLSNDTDGDGLSDGEEFYIYSTNVTREDSDFDGVNDLLEIRKFKTSPNDNDNPYIFRNDSNHSDYKWHNISNLLTHKDTDGDGVRNTLDNCPETDSGENVNEFGCSYNDLNPPTDTSTSQGRCYWSMDGYYVRLYVNQSECYDTNRASWHYPPYPYSTN